ncbi:calcium sensor EFh [Rhodopirellula sp. MGV]|nr:calcium sensor EFh [Rhodopirellula sp. MGV]PNY33611.1 alpha/beta hydrolase [Rhodopirellula baltica]
MHGSIASAQAPPQRSGTRPTFDQVLQREDANQDGEINRSEFKGPARLFDRLDRDGSGAITRKEFEARRPPNTNPPRQGRPTVPSDVIVQRDVVFGTGGGRDLKMHLVLPKDSTTPRPAYVWIHGGGWMGGTKDGGVAKVTPMVRKGFVGATIEYRLTGEAPFPAQIEDCKCAIRYLRAHAKDYNIDPDRIAVGGSSAGGHLVALLGTSGDAKDLEGSGGWQDQSSKVQAVVDFFGPTDFQLFVTARGYENHNRDGSPESRLLGGGEVLSNPDGIKRVNPITYIDKDDPPFLIIHGTKDGTVPPNQSEALHEALDKVGVQNQLHLIDGAGHGGSAFSAPEVNRMVETFLSDCFADPTAE